MTKPTKSRNLIFFLKLSLFFMT